MGRANPVSPHSLLLPGKPEKTGEATNRSEVKSQFCRAGFGKGEWMMGNSRAESGSATLPKSLSQV